LIEIWETFLMQLDAEEDGHAFYKPPIEPSARSAADRQHSGEAAEQSQAAAVVTAQEHSD
jgi:sorting nexin-1/2